MYVVRGETTAFLLCGSENQFSETLNYEHELALSTDSEYGLQTLEM